MWVRIVVSLLLIIPIVALVAVPTYSNATPELWGWPFFYWYSVLWMFITTALCATAYVLVARARRNGGSR
jgi:Protein of unknown function (DUF3311)